MSRAGLNTTLSYQYGGKTYQFQARVSQLAHGSQLVSDEAQARTRRAYYPHQVTAIPFTLTMIINGYKERVQFSNYLNDYVSRALDPNLSVSNFPLMFVAGANRGFTRWGVPLSGIEWGDHIGSMVWAPQVTFTSAVDPSLGQSTKGYSNVSTFSLPVQTANGSPQIKYFYPAGVQLSGNQVPDASAYDKVVSIQDIQNIINGGTPGGSDSGVDPITGVNPINNGMG